MTSSSLLTAEELFRMSIPHKRVELVQGVLVVREPPGYLHGDVTARLAHQLMNHVEARSLGRVLVGDTGFKLHSAPDTVRGPDIAFISAARLPDPRPVGYPALSPDLVVEVLSPTDRAGEVLAKVADWLNAGTRLIWVIDPERRLARAYRADGSLTLLTADESLDGEDVVPGFACRLASVL